MTALTKIRAAFANSPESLWITALLTLGLGCAGVFGLLAAGVLA